MSLQDSSTEEFRFELWILIPTVKQLIVINNNCTVQITLKMQNKC